MNNMNNTLHLLFMLLLSITGARSLCRPGWNNWGGRCYYMSTSSKNW